MVTTHTTGANMTIQLSCFGGTICGSDHDADLLSAIDQSGLVQVWRLQQGITFGDSLVREFDRSRLYVAVLNCLLHNARSEGVDLFAWIPTDARGGLQGPVAALRFKEE